MTWPYLIESSIPSPLLFELADGRFHILQSGTLSPFMAGYGYLLVEQEFAEFLQQIEVERIAVEPAVLYSPVTGEEFHSHVRIRVSQFFSANDISDLNLSGLRILTLNDEYYFVSPDLKDALEARSFGYLSFSEGLSEFAAGAD